MKHHIPTATYGERITVEQHNYVIETPYVTLNGHPIQQRPFKSLPVLYRLAIILNPDWIY